MGVNIDLMDVGGVEDGYFFVKFRVRDRKSDYKWVLVAVYGAAQPEFTESFLMELVQACRGENLPLCIGGDFNIIRNSSEKTTTILMRDGPFCSTQSLTAWIYVRLRCRVVDLPGLTLVGYLHMRG
jgi:hypothetical protein